MNISIVSENKSEYLLIISKGDLVTKEDLFKRVDMIYAEIVKSGKEKILIEQTETTFPSNLFSYADLVNYYQTNFPSEIRHLRVAVVLLDEYKKIAEFWETYCHNRGFQFFAFNTFQDAHNWLTDKTA